jgi:hypothetical protein
MVMPDTALSISGHICHYSEPSIERGELASVDALAPNTRAEPIFT